MNCTDIQNNIDDYLDLSLNADDSQSFDSHVSHCPVCQATLLQAEIIKQALSNLPIEDADDNFEKRVLTNVHKHYGRNEHHKFTAGFATAMAASLAIWFAVSLFQPEASLNNSTTINLALETQQTVKLKFDAPTALDQVSLSIELPEHVELSGYPGQKSLSWETRLTKGSNILSLPIKAISNGKGEMIANIKYGNKTKRFNIILISNLNGAWQYQLKLLPTA